MLGWWRLAPAGSANYLRGYSVNNKSEQDINFKLASYNNNELSKLFLFSSYANSCKEEKLQIITLKKIVVILMQIFFNHPIFASKLRVAIF